jgi:hypothetical protein
MVKNKTIIDKLMDKHNNGEDLVFDKDFDNYIKNYDINRHNINTNNKVCFLLSRKLKKEFQNDYNEFIRLAIDELFYNVSEDELINIKKMAELNIQLRWTLYKNNHEQYKFINMINKKYNRPIQSKIIIKRPSNFERFMGRRISGDEFSKNLSVENGKIFYTFN